MTRKSWAALSRRRNGNRLRPRLAGRRQLPARDPPDEALARSTDEKRHAEPMEQARMGDQSEVVGERLAEAETGICGDARTGECRRLPEPRCGAPDSRRPRAPRPRRSGCPAWSWARPAHASARRSCRSRPRPPGFRNRMSARDTSLKILAPALAAARITEALPRVDRNRPLGSPRALDHRQDAGELSCSTTASEPGRVDSPPMSTMSAPACGSSAAWVDRRSVVSRAPPSEKLSGVTLTMPMSTRRGRGRGPRRAAARAARADAARRMRHRVAACMRRAPSP